MSPRSFLTIVFIFLTHAGAFAELAIGKPRWGFDGTVAKNTFNILSIEIRNTGSAAFDGVIALSDSSGGRASAPYKAQAFIAPGAVRWVQFFPYIGNYIPEWELEWNEGKGAASAGLNKAGERILEGPGAVVILAAADDPTLRSTRMPVFDEALFPPSVAATDSLHAVILDHQPKLDPARREAFLDWLRRGGIVHLLPGPDGVFPQFTDDFSPLNISGEKAHVGAGLVAKHAASRAEITTQTLTSAGYAMPALRGDNSDSWRNDDSTFFTQLAGLTKPNIAWPLIYLLTIVYVGLIGPVFYMLRKRDYRILLGGFVLTVAAFAWIFTIVGRRGYGEKQIYHSVGIAQSLGGARHDVLHWVHAFATVGDTYRLAYPGTGNVFAVTSIGGDTVRASVLQGKDGGVIADIPLFSSRPFHHRGVLSGPDLGLSIAEIGFAPSNPPRDQLAKLTLRTGGGFPANHIKAAIQYRDRFHSLSRKDATLVASVPHSTELRHALGSSNGNEQDHYYGRTQSAAESYANLQRMGGTLAARISNIAGETRAGTVRAQSPDTIRVFIFAPAPDAFHMQGAQFQAGTELILYVQDIPLPNP